MIFSSGLIEDACLLAFSFVLYYRCTEDPNPTLDAEDKAEPVADKFILRRVKQSKYIYAAVSLFDLYLGATSPSTLPRAAVARLRLLRRVGFGILIGGAALRIWAIETLGRLFTFRLAVRKDHRVVRSGPFAFVRHPSYTGAQIMIAGEIILMLAGNLGQQYLRSESISTARISLYALIPALLPTIILVPRLNKEEKMLLDAFGNEYRSYQNQVRYKLLPGLV